MYEDGIELVEVEDEQVFENVIAKMLDTIDVDDLLRRLKIALEEKNTERFFYFYDIDGYSSNIFDKYFN